MKFKNDSQEDSGSESDWSDSEVSDTADIDEETLHKSKKPLKNPFFNKKTDSSEDSDSSDISDDSDDTEGESDADEATKFETEDQEEEDSLIRALKAAKKPKDRTCPPDIRVSKRDLTDLVFHPQQNLIATALIDGEINVFEYSNEANHLRKKLKIHKQTVRSLDFTRDGKCLISGCTNAALKVTDVVSIRGHHCVTFLLLA